MHVKSMLKVKIFKVIPHKYKKYLIIYLNKLITILKNITKNETLTDNYIYDNIRLNLKSFSLLNLKLRNLIIVPIRIAKNDRIWTQTIIKTLKIIHSFCI